MFPSVLVEVMKWVCIGLGIVTVITALVFFGLNAYKKDKKAEEKVVLLPEPKPAPVKKAPVVKKAEPVVEAPAPVVEEPAPVVEAPAPVVEVIEDDEEGEGKERIKSIPFAQKMLFIDKNTQTFYDVFNNEMLTYRKMHARVSNKGVSYRFGRELVAKVTLRGKTLKAHFALDIKKFDEGIYFQKDMSDVKAYEEVPFTVKIKSERASKRSLALIAALAEKFGIEKKTRNIETVDSIEELKVIANEKK